MDNIKNIVGIASTLKRLIVAVITIGSLSCAAIAQESTEEQVNLASDSSAAAVENDANSEQATLEELLADIKRNEVALYELFNELNSKDDFDIVCSELEAESLEAARSRCEPAFFEKIRQQNRDDIVRGRMSDVGFFGRLRESLFGPWELSENEVRTRAADALEQVQLEFESLAASHPPLFAQLQLVGRLQNDYFVWVKNSRREDGFFMRENSPGYHSGLRQDRAATASATPWFSAPPPGHTQPVIHFGRRDQPFNR